LEEVRSLAGDGTFASPIDVGTHRNVVWSGRVLTLPACVRFSLNRRSVHRL
jgi:hypothetical protein